MNNFGKFRAINNEKGQVVIIAVVFLAIILGLVVSLMEYTTFHIKAEQTSINSQKAILLAEAGIEKAIYELNQNSNFSGDSDFLFGDGEFTTSITTIDTNSKRIVSTAYIPNSENPKITKTVKATINISLATVSFMFGAQIGDGGLTMANNSVINGNVFSNGNISGSGAISGSASVAAGTAPNADQEWTTSDSDFVFGDNVARKDVAQSFVPLVTNKINKVSLYLKKFGNPGDLTIRILSDNAGKPSKTVLASGTISAALLTSNYGFVNGAFSTNPNLVGGQKYWIEVSAPSINATNYFSWGKDSTDGYVSGTGKYSANWNASTPVWNLVAGDLNFKTYMGGVDTSLSGVSIGGDAYGTILSGCSITGNAYFTNSNSCSVGGNNYPGTTAPAPTTMPISESQITEWETNAQNGGVIGSYILTNNATASLGPVKINGDLILSNGAKIYLTGPVWVNGNITLSNNSGIIVDASLGNAGTVLIGDYPTDRSLKGIINTGNNAVMSGNGNPYSFPIILSTNTGNTAISISNGIVGAIFYAPYGGITLSNGVTANQITADSVHINNNSVINYVSGLQHAVFSSGPGASWAYKPGSYVIVK